MKYSYQEISKSKAQLYAGLSQTKMRARHGLFVVEGEKAVRDSIGDFTLEAIVTTGEKCVEWPVDRSKIFKASREIMAKISNLTTPPDIIAIFKIPENEEKPYENINPDSLYVMLDGVRDPGNMGTIVRTCHWFGVTHLFCSHDCVDVYNPKTVQACMGSLGKVKVIYCDLISLIERCKEMPVYGLLLEGENIYEASLESRGFVVMGNEGVGISKELRKHITSPLLIPPGNPGNHSESLNVSVATAVTLALFASRKAK